MRKQDVTNPLATVRANGDQRGEVSLLKIRRGISGRTVVEVVINIGRSLKLAASTIAVLRENSFFLNRFMLSTNRMPLFTTIPVNIIAPISTPIPTACFLRNSNVILPIPANGMVVNIMKG